MAACGGLGRRWAARRVMMAAALAAASGAGDAGAARGATGFMVVALPDVQNYNQYYPTISVAQTQWIVSNRAADNIAYVTQLGDLVNTDTDLTQYANANAAMNVLDGPKPAGLVPYGVLPGNHDLTNGAGPNYLANFGPSRTAGYSWYGGSSPDGLSNYEVFTAGSYSMLGLNLKYAPTDAGTIAWTRGVLATHTSMPTILSTHDYLNVDGTRSANGTSVWNSVVTNYPQVFMVLCGHNHGENQRVDAGAAGQKVAQILSDYQDDANGGDGFLREMVFDPAAGKIQIKTYSPTRGDYQVDGNSQFCYTATFGAGTIAIGSVVIPVASAAWAGAYTQNFDGMGTTGTTLPTGWSVLDCSTGNTTYGAGAPITGAAMAIAAAPATQTLEVWNATSAAKTFTVAANVGLTAASSDRALGTNPTLIGAKALQLVLQNTAAGPMTKVTVRYDLEMLTNATEDLPGMAFFYSLTGGTTAADWTRVDGLSSTGAGTFSATVDLTGNPLGVGGYLYLRWADDNAAASSPDATLAVDNVVVTGVAVPEVGTLGVVLLGMGVVMGRRRRGSGEC